MKTYLETPVWEVLPHLPYSPDIAPSDYYLFGSTTDDLAEQHFLSYKDAKKWVISWIASKDVSFSQRGIHIVVLASNAENGLNNLYIYIVTSMSGCLSECLEPPLIIPVSLTTLLRSQSPGTHSRPFLFY